MLYDVLFIAGAVSGMSCLIFLGLKLGTYGANILTAWNNGNHSMVHDRIV